MRNPKSRDAQEETMDAPWRKKVKEGNRRQMADISEEANGMDMGKLWIPEAIGPAGMRMTHSAKVAQQKEHGLQREGKDDIVL
jgi:hypothetical protein